MSIDPASLVVSWSLLVLKVSVVVAIAEILVEASSIVAIVAIVIAVLLILAKRGITTIPKIGVLIVVIVVVVSRVVVPLLIRHEIAGIWVEVLAR